MFFFQRVEGQNVKAGALSKVKFLKLKRRLAIPQWQVVGLLESLWLFTQMNCPAGDVGRFSDDDIAAGIEWSGSAEILIEAMVECGWLDRCPANRLLVHGWEEHAPTYLKGAVSRHHGQFAKHGAKHGAKQDTQQDAKEDAEQVEHVAKQLTSQVASLPNLTKPNQVSPNQTKPLPPSVVVDCPGPTEEEFIEAWNALGAPFSRVISITKGRRKALATRCRDKFWREQWGVALSRVPGLPFLRGENDRGWVADVDFFLRPDTVQKIVEGKYANRNGKHEAKQPMTMADFVAQHSKGGAS